MSSQIYSFSVQELKQGYIDVEAENFDEAEELVVDAYGRGKIPLTKSVNISGQEDFHETAATRINIKVAGGYMEARVIQDGTSRGIQVDFYSEEQLEVVPVVVVEKSEDDTDIRFIENP